MHDKQDSPVSRLNDWDTGAILTNLGLNSVTSLRHIKWDFISTSGYLKDVNENLATRTLAWGLLPYASFAPLAVMLLEQFVRGAK